MGEVLRNTLVLGIVVSSSMALIGALVWSCIERLSQEPWLRHSFTADDDQPGGLAG